MASEATNAAVVGALAAGPVVAQQLQLWLLHLRHSRVAAAIVASRCLASYAPGRQVRVGAQLRCARWSSVPPCTRACLVQVATAARKQLWG